MPDKIIILDFGSQYTRLIARKIRELNVYCEVYPYDHFPEIDESVKGVILSGSPLSVRGKNAPIPDLSLITGLKPLLGICYGAQYLAHNYGGKVTSSEYREYGRANLKYINNKTMTAKTDSCISESIRSKFIKFAIIEITITPITVPIILPSPP